MPVVSLFYVSISNILMKEIALKKTKFSVKRDIILHFCKECCTVWLIRRQLDSRLLLP